MTRFLWKALSTCSIRCLLRCPPNRLLSLQQQQDHDLYQQLQKQQQQQQQDQEEEQNRKRKQKLMLLSCALTSTMFVGFYLWKESRLRDLEAQTEQGRVGHDASFGSSSASGGASRSSLAVGGDFRLMDHTGRYVTRADLSRNSGWLLVYFGFCHCPDICPEQMEKMVEVVDRLQLSKEPLSITPVFISIDPERDSPALVKEYIADFSNKFVGLTGTKPEVDEVAKKYRVYYSKGPVDQDGDYIVDHAIIMYLVSPEGAVVDYYGQTKTSREIAGCISKVIKTHRPA